MQFILLHMSLEMTYLPGSHQFLITELVKKKVHNEPITVVENQTFQLLDIIP